VWRTAGGSALDGAGRARSDLDRFRVGDPRLAPGPAVHSVAQIAWQIDELCFAAARPCAPGATSRGLPRSDPASMVGHV
jgi:hypothetical protein